MRSLLDHQADGIEYTLHSHGIEASVAGGNISPRLIQFHIKLGAGAKYNRVAALSDELALALGVTHCRITRDGYYVKIEVPRPDPVAVQLFPLMRNLPGDLPFNSAVLGLDESGVPLLLRLDSPDIGHILISGMTGSGKTVLARSMIASLALQNQPDELKMLLIDPKGRGFSDFEGLPNLVCPIVTDPADGVHRLKWAVRHLDKRDENGLNSPVLVIFIDELTDLVQIGGREVEHLITRITQRGRDVGIHLVACTQKPSPNVIGSVARSNFPTRLVGRVVTAEDARLASGVAGSGADKLMGRGDFLLLAGGEITRVQAAHISPDEMVQTVTHLGGQPPLREPSRVGRRERVAERSGSSSRQVQPQHTQAAPQRHEFRRRQDDYEPDGDDWAEDDYPPRRQPARRQYQSALTLDDTDRRGEQAGVADRLARYKEDIQARRRVQPRPKPPEDYFDEAEEADPADYQPARPTTRRPAPTRPPVPTAPRPQAKTWEDEDIDLDAPLPPDFDDLTEDEDDQAEEVATRRPAPRSMPATTRYSSQLDGRNVITDFKTRTTGSFKIGS